MKLTKKLLPALGMLALSACMLVTSTFAWFSMNEDVTATNMSVTAKGNQVYLQIINPNATENVLGEDGEPTGETTPVVFKNGAPQTSAAATSQTGNILPVNVVNKINEDKKSCRDYGVGDTVDGKASTDYATMVWVTNVGKDTTDGSAIGEYKAITSGTEANYYLKNTFNIRLDPTAGAEVAGNPLRVDAVAAKTTDTKDTTFQKCLSVLVVCKIGDTTMGGVWEYGATGFTCVKGTATLSAAAFAKDQIAVVYVYVFFNGDNANCTQENLAKAANGGYGVELSFSVATPAQNG